MRSSSDGQMKRISSGYIETPRPSRISWLLVRWFSRSCWETSSPDTTRLDGPHMDPLTAIEPGRVRDVNLGYERAFLVRWSARLRTHRA